MLFKHSDTTSPPPPPDRSQRSICWGARDAYFSCLQTHHQTSLSQLQPNPTKYYFVPGEEPSTVCKPERTGYHADCAKSWVDHFNQRIVNEQRSTATRLALSNPTLQKNAGSR